MSKTTELEKAAKEAFAASLVNEGHSDVRIISSPADIVSVSPRGAPHFWEIKATDVTGGEMIFGAATATEVNAALADSEHYAFVIAQRLPRGSGGWSFERFSVHEFLAYCSLPPPKIFFHIAADPKRRRARRRKSAIAATPSRLAMLSSLFTKFRS